MKKRASFREKYIFDNFLAKFLPYFLVEHKGAPLGIKHKRNPLEGKQKGALLGDKKRVSYWVESTIGLHIARQIKDGPIGKQSKGSLIARRAIVVPGSGRPAGRVGPGRVGSRCWRVGLGRVNIPGPDLTRLFYAELTRNVHF